jgi:NAD(P)-dependent dehydrogenase (short-subunit alcohol dehydrogenase family)
MKAVLPTKKNISLTNRITRLQASIGNDKESQERRRNLEKMIPMQRVTEPSDVANAVWFLASGQSSFVTGITFPVDGGRGV